MLESCTSGGDHEGIGSAVGSFFVFKSETPFQKKVSVGSQSIETPYGKRVSARPIETLETH